MGYTTSDLVDHKDELRIANRLRWATLKMDKNKDKAKLRIANRLRWATLLV